MVKIRRQQRWFQYPITVALNQEQIKSHPERISNIKPFINQYHWKKKTFHQIKKSLEWFWKKQTKQ